MKRLLLALAIAAPLAAQAPTGNPAADAAYFKGDWATALSGYQSLAKTDSANPIIWFRLGAAQHGLQHYPEAISALLKASKLGFQPLAVRLRLSRSYALAGNRELALDYADSVAQLTPSGGVVPAMFAIPDFDSIKNDSRFVASLAKIEAVRYPCRSMPEAQQFNFWIGVWDVHPWGTVAGGAGGVNDVHPILEHCVISENWAANLGGGEGKSYNFYDTNIKKWRQIWMGDGGGSLDYTGEFRDGAMRFVGWNLDAAGHRLEQKLTFTPFGRDTVRQTFEQSADAGKTWTVTFDGRYVRRP